MVLQDLIKVIILSTISFNLRGQETKGYFEYDTLVKTTYEYHLYEKRMEKRIDYVKELRYQIVNNFEQFLNNSTPHNIDSINTEIKKIGEYLARVDSAIKKEDDRLKNEIKLNIMDKVKHYCIQNNIFCLADKKAVLYCNNCSDYTVELIRYFNKKEQ